jgi:broad specificity phosphatase PhoE
MRLFLLITFTFLSFAQESINHTVYLVRHAEKELNQGSDPNLTPSGEKRAKALVSQLSSAKISTIFSSNYKRTQQTAAPLAKELKLDVKSYNPMKATAVLEFLQSAKSPQNILLVGHSNTLGKSIADLGGPPIAAIADSDYSNLFILTIIVDGKEKHVSLTQLHL